MRTALCLVSLLALALVPAVGAAGSEQQLASLRISPTAVDWQLQLAGGVDVVTLRVSDPSGNVVTKEFRGGSPTFSAFDANGQTLADGTYHWEMTAAPRLRPIAAAARRAADVGGETPTMASAARTQSGSFTIAGGVFVDDSAVEGRGPRAMTAPLQSMTAADQVIPDDLIVQGSTCVGFDCVNNESFGFDTIRLKENNTRIKFEDTSVGTFPTNDWQLTANDSASGGSSKFSIEDITGSRVPFTITAGAATNSIFVDSTGRLGLRSSTPVLDLHINTSNTPAIRLEQNNSGGFTAQTWDIAGNEANFFVRDVTGGSKLSFRIRPGAPTSSIDINADGNVGIGTASADNQLHVFCDGAGETCGRVENTNATGFSGFEFANEDGTLVANFSADNAANNFRLNAINNHPVVFMTNSAEHLRVETDGDIGINCNAAGSDLVVASGAGCANPASNLNAGAAQFTVTSSRTVKENLSPIAVPDLLDKIAAVDVYEYDFIDGPKDRMGLMAEDFHQIFGRGSDRLLNGDEVQMALWLAVKELTSRNKELTDRLAALETKLADGQQKN